VTPEEGGGWVDPILAEEFPGLALAVRSCPGPVPGDPGVTERLAAVASRIRGRSAIEMRRETVPAAYRAFYRQVGLDPDAEMTPVEAAVGRRLFDGGVKAGDPLRAALELAVLETGAPVYAFDAGALVGSLEVRASLPGEELAGPQGLPVRSRGRLVVADEVGPLSLLFGEACGRGAPMPTSGELLLVAIGVSGVAPMVLDEALEIALGALGG
jgi:DNA/RNA-binding domain of Phe-tRNA-synthetase-like protein